MAHVYIIGAGPGNIDYLTKGALDIIKKADVILYDRLASSEILNFAPNTCEFIYVGKSSKNHILSQEKINELLCQKALELEIKTVVRLKGGDPYVFGRGGEEVLALKEKNILYTVIPGITSVIGALASAGIPVTHRNVAESFHVITGHTKSGELSSQMSLFAKLRGTLIFLMGVEHLSQIVESLISNGKPKDTAVAIIEKGSTVEERRINGRLDTIVSIAKTENIKPPALIVVGENSNFDFRCHGNVLFGKKIGILGTSKFVFDASSKFKEYGAYCYQGNILKINTLNSFNNNKNINSLKEASWLVFTSSNGVIEFFANLKRFRIDIRELFGKKIAVVGLGTKNTLENFGIIADYCPNIYTVKDLAEGLVLLLNKRDKVVILRSEYGSKEIDKVFDKHSICYTDISLYSLNVDQNSLNTFYKIVPFLNYIVLGSSSCVRAFFNKNLDDIDYSATKFVCIGKLTAETLHSYINSSKILVADEFTIDGIVNTVLKN
ncbi:MAG: uroporphyrinogen-III C-methyltransferase [Succinivibrionaceae bacterium]